MSFADDPLSAIKERRRQLFRRLVVLYVGGTTAMSAMILWFDHYAEGGKAFWLLLYAILLPPGGTVLLLWSVRRANNRIVAFLEAIRPRLEKTNASGRGQISSLLLDNGIVLGLGQGVGVVSFQRYFGASGTPVQLGPQDTVSWIRKLRNLPTVTVTTTKGPASIREGLERFKTLAGARWARLFLHESRRDSGGVFGPRARVTLVAQIPRLLARGVDVLNVLDQVRVLLDDSYGALMASGGDLRSAR